jgi:hypothetical protein
MAAGGTERLIASLPHNIDTVESDSDTIVVKPKMMPSVKMRYFEQRLITFEQSHPPKPAKFTALKDKKKPESKEAAQELKRPHEFPKPDLLAHAGFFYSPSPNAADNVTCFFCGVKRADWQAADDPLQEHCRATGPSQHL